MLTPVRPNPPKCCPKEEENGGDGFWWWAGTPIAMPPLGAEGPEIDGEPVDEKEDPEPTGAGEAGGSEERGEEKCG